MFLYKVIVPMFLYNCRVYEKRKMAALEVERIVRELVSRNDIKQVIRGLLKLR